MAETQSYEWERKCSLASRVFLIRTARIFGVMLIGLLAMSVWQEHGVDLEYVGFFAAIMVLAFLFGVGLSMLFPFQMKFKVSSSGVEVTRPNPLRSNRIAAPFFFLFPKDKTTSMTWSEVRDVVIRPDLQLIVLKQNGVLNFLDFFDFSGGGSSLFCTEENFQAVNDMVTALWNSAKHRDSLHP